MIISNDKGGKLKIALLSSAIYLVVNGVAWGFFGDKSTAFCILISGFTIVFVILFFINRIRRLVSDVQLVENSITYRVAGKQFEISKDQILKIGDSGLTSGPHDINIFLRNGDTVSFFPSEKYGSFYRGKLKAILQSWLVQDP